MSPERFEFGTNWRRFLPRVDAQRIERAKQSLCEMLEVRDLAGKSFLDVGSGSGLFSLAARKLGARVVSFDIDEQSVLCTRQLRDRCDTDCGAWRITRGSVLDAEFFAGLGSFDVVYSWGVLHHTGALWQAAQHVLKAVAPGGLLYLAIYNDQGAASRRWRQVKRWYNTLPRPLPNLLLWAAFARLWGPTTIRDACRGRPLRTWREYSRRSRGMSPWHDVVDWVGGYPFEVAKPEEVLNFCRPRGFQLLRLATCGGGRGCNEYVFRRMPEAAHPGAGSS
jgi:2-polyprenyl-6-hydroxyphenyl methylase/3-demethylubiquinone-9 3-methyltransferase